MNCGKITCLLQFGCTGACHMCQCLWLLIGSHMAQATLTQSGLVGLGTMHGALGVFKDRHSSVLDCVKCCLYDVRCVRPVPHVAAFALMLAEHDAASASYPHMGSCLL